MKTSLLTLLLVCANLVYAQNYQYLGSYSADGTPDYLEPVNDTITGETLEMIDAALPESYPVPDYNPQYISSGYDTDILLDAEADVWVTFVAEGAGYKNVLGFYTYDVATGPTSRPTAEDITIIFPNVSAQWSGGGLVAGNKVRIGRFPAGTGIGWVLLANGYQNNSVTSGLWQLFSTEDFNPENQAELRTHNVLLKDPSNERIILGFEDIRRDYASCDQDFNDAIFYITANPFTALRTSNLSKPDSGAKTVSSGNNGGLESNGDLASLIAKRNLARLKSPTQMSKKSHQPSFATKSASSSAFLDSYLPSSGKYGTESARYSSPTDLLGITNATEVLSVDYYRGEERIAAVLSTATQGGIYDHSKAICDRLNGSSLDDIRTVRVRGHQLMLSKIIRHENITEYAVSFSIKQGATSNELYSFWNIDRYPTGAFVNYQIWGGSYSQVFHIVNHIIDTHTSEKALESYTYDNVVPELFVKSGVYEDGNLHLTINNKNGHETLYFEGYAKETEQDIEAPLVQTIDLNQEFTQTVTIPTGHLFDIGFSIAPTVGAQIDALYMADGPWGLDYLQDQVVIDSFTIEQGSSSITEGYAVERNPAISGQLKETLNLFRHMKAGDQVLSISDYGTVSFTLKNSRPVEVIVLTDQETNWENRLRVTLPIHDTNEDIHLELSEFVDANGQSATIENIRSIVFSISGDYKDFQPFDLAVSNVYFGNEALSVEKVVENDSKSLHNYPNPFSHTTTIQLESASQNIDLRIIDMLGRVVDSKNIATTGAMEVSYTQPNLATGVYNYIIVDDRKKAYRGRMVIQ